MDKATAAIIVSAISAGVAFLSLGWHIYRDVILKPRLKVKLRLMTAISQDFIQPIDFISISGANLGPGSITVEQIYIKKRR